MAGFSVHRWVYNRLDYRAFFVRQNDNEMTLNGLAFVCVGVFFYGQ